MSDAAGQRQRDDAVGRAAPTTWLLVGRRAGDNAQVAALAAALGWPCETKQLDFGALHRVPNLLLGASLRSLAPSALAQLRPPWPDLVIFSGKRSVPAARWVRRQSGNRTRLVGIGRPFAPLAWLDLVVTTPQYGLPTRPNVLRNPVALTALGRSGLMAAAAERAPSLAHLPRPYVALLVGGSAAPYRLDAAGAAELALRARRLAGAGTVLATTSPRTPSNAIDALERALPRSALVHRWQAGADNPYAAFLGLADRIVVTGDSAAMLSDACAAGKPVYIAELPTRWDGLRRRLNGRWPGWLRRAGDCLVEVGILVRPRDMAAFHAGLVARGLARRLGEDAQGPPPSASPADSLAATAARVRALFGRA